MGLFVCNCGFEMNAPSPSETAFVMLSNVLFMHASVLVHQVFGSSESGDVERKKESKWQALLSLDQNHTPSPSLEPK
jgi:hypothetical protein